jgi:hypothetical protein
MGVGDLVRCPLGFLGLLVFEPPLMVLVLFSHLHLVVPVDRSPRFLKHWWV